MPYTLYIINLLFIYIYSFLYLEKTQTKNKTAVQTYQVYINCQNKISNNDKDIFREIYLEEKLHLSVFVLKKVSQEFFQEVLRHKPIS